MPLDHITLSPLEVTFEGKLPDEKVFHIFDKHWVTDLLEIIMLFLLYILPITVMIVLTIIYPTASYISYMWIFGSFYVIFFGLFLYIRWLNDALDIFILTDKRLVDVTQRGFLHRQTTIAELRHIQHAKFIQKGFVDNIFHIGSVDVKTAGTDPDMRLEYIHNPPEVADLIMDFVGRYNSGLGNS